MEMLLGHLLSLLVAEFLEQVCDSVGEMFAMRFICLCGSKNIFHRPTLWSLWTSPDCQQIKINPYFALYICFVNTTHTSTALALCSHDERT